MVLEAPAMPQTSDRSSILLWRSGAEVALSNLDTACYAVLRGLEFVRGRQLAPTEYEIVLRDPDSTIEALIAEFTNSQCARFADTIRRIKLVITKPPRRDRGYRF